MWSALFRWAKSMNIKFLIYRYIIWFLNDETHYMYFIYRILNQLKYEPKTNNFLKYIVYVLEHLQTNFSKNLRN